MKSMLFLDKIMFFLLFVYTDNFLKSDNETPWTADKFDAQDGLSSTDNNESAQKLMASQYDER